MAAFACFSTNEEKTTGSYKSLIQRFKQKTLEEFEHPEELKCVHFKYFLENKGKSIHTLRDFIYELRKAEFLVPCIILCENPCGQLKHYVALIEEVQLGDSENACALYGDITKIVTSFMNYFTYIIDDNVKKIHKNKHFITNELLLTLIDKTIDLAEENQRIFIEEYVPTPYTAEQEKFNEIMDKHDKYVEQIKKIRAAWEGAHKQESVEEFINEHFEVSIKKINQMCNFTHSYISMMLADRLYEIGVSVEASVDRIASNMRLYDEECNESLNILIQKLYDKNKEKLTISRRDRLRSTDAAEVKRGIEMIKDKIDHYGNEETVARLVLENRFWLKTLKDFHDIASMFMKVKAELEKIRSDEDKYNSLRLNELPGSKAKSFEMIGKKINERKLYLEHKLVEISRTLITFFCVRGTDRILYADSLGLYYCDEFNHQNYISDHGLKYYHVNCVGDYLENLETDPYYFDENGRYIIENGEKVHQCAPCTSHYKITDDGRFKKITVDCGHSVKVNDKCRLAIKDLTDVEILPKTEIIDITKTLDSDTVKYLWDSFGMILPEVLYDLAVLQPKNPIHIFAHVLIRRRFEATDKELAYSKKKAQKYRANIHKERREAAAEARREWRSKLIKRNKDADNTLEWDAYSRQIADWQFVNSLGYYN